MESKKERLFYIDNIRLLMIVFVVMHHLAITYGGSGMWYYTEKANLGVLSKLWFTYFLTFNQAYFMGILFLIAGYFSAGSYDRKGFERFVGSRFVRLAVPALIYMIVITPFIGMVELHQKWHGFHILGFLSGTGVMWFAAALFIFSVIYGLVRRIAGRLLPVIDKKLLKPSFRNAVLLILIIGVCTFLIRIVQPVGTSILNMQLGYFASYIILFIMGMMAYRKKWFAEISYKSGKRWIFSGIALGFITWLALVVIGTKYGASADFQGGLTWQSAGLSLWEAFVAVAMSLGLIAVFREKFNRQSKLIKAMSDSSFAVYMFHPAIIVAIALLFRPFAALPIVKWLILCAICVPVCFVVSHFILRKIPLLKNIL